MIKYAIPTPSRFGHGHPAKRVFQALRIATNDELESLREGLEAAVDLLQPGGRMAVISFHSLEDRMVKQFIREEARGCTCPPDFPICVCGHSPALRALTTRAVVPGADERMENPRSASAKLRAAERAGRAVSAVAPARAGCGGSGCPRGIAAGPGPRSDRCALRRLSTSGLIWMAVLTLLLGGLVALNVAALRSTIGVSDVNTRRCGTCSSRTACRSARYQPR